MSGPEFRGRVYDNIAETVGATPVVRLSRLAADAGVKAEILAKCEFFNPLSSVKDRIGVSMIEALEQEGKLDKDTVVVEPTSGNTGIGLAFVCAAKGYRLILTMPESMSVERRKMLRLLGAQLELTPAEKGMNGAIARAEELMRSLPKAVMPQQFKNAANPAVHRRTTAEEIWRDLDGKLDAMVSGIGTGGTFTGCAEVLKPRLPHLRMIAVEPEESPVLSGGAPGRHFIQGIGAGFVPDIMNTKAIDEIIRVPSHAAFTMARKVAMLEGLPVGISSGAALSAALQVGARPGMEGKRVLAVLPSSAERYLSTALFEGL